MELTLSVRSFQVPATPGTCAWPPRLPSVPTSRATRVTSSAKARQLVHHRVDGLGQRGDLALGLDGDLLGQVAAGRPRWRPGRCCAPGRSGCAAIELTLSVRSFQVPADAADLGLAAELALGADLAGHAGDLVGEGGELVDHRVDVVFSSRISPRASTVIFWVRSPWATAVVTWAMLRTWAVRLPAMQLTLSVRSFQVPATPCTSAWPPSRPSVPTSRATRVTSSANAESWSTIVLMVVFELEDLARARRR